MWFLQPGIGMADVITRILAALAVVFLSLPLHEYIQGLLACKLGDETAKDSGFLTLNPLVHFDPLGAFSILVFDIGWAKKIPMNPQNFEKPKRDTILVALFGPLSHMTSALFGTIVLNSFAFMPDFSLLSLFQKFLSYFILINISLCVFNFLPIPPLDGYRVLESLIPDKYLLKYYLYYPFILITLLILMLFGFFDIPLMFIRSTVFRIVIKLGSLPFMLMK